MAEPAVVIEALTGEHAAGRLPGTEGEAYTAAALEEWLTVLGARAPEHGQSMIRPVPLAEPLSGEGRNVAARLGPEAPPRVILTAHHDGFGDGRVLRGEAGPGEVGRLHPGADDNASGVATVLRAVERLQAADAPPPPVLVLFTTAEEAGSSGARQFAAEQADHFPAARPPVVVLDQTGRLSGETLYYAVPDAGTAESLLPELSAAAARAELRLERLPGAAARSDAAAFHGAGYPAVLISTGLHDDANRPADSAEKLNYAGMERVALFTEALVRELAAGDPAPATE